ADHTFDVIPPRTMHPAMHVALDEVLPGEVAAGRRPPLLRIWDWDAPLVVIGSFQSVRNEVDPEGLARHDMMVVRRISGGGAMFMEPGNCITYSLVVPTSLVEGLSFERSYAFLDDWVLGALADVGIEARYVPLNDIASEEGKIGGAAQKRFASGVVLHHVTMSYDIDAEKMLEVLRIGREKMSDKGTKSANKRVDPMRRQTGMAREDIIDAFIAHFEGRYDTVRSDYTPEELARAEELMRTKFLTEAWTHRVPRGAGRPSRPRPARSRTVPPAPRTLGPHLPSLCARAHRRDGVCPSRGRQAGSREGRRPVLHPDTAGPPRPGEGPLRPARRTGTARCQSTRR